MYLQELLVNIASIAPKQNCNITGLSQDSRTLQPGDLFFAYPGTQTDGRQYISEAINKGALAVLMHPNGQKTTHQSGIPIITIFNLDEHISEIAARFYGYPSQDMTLIGVTGTNGKTSCTHFIAACLAQAGRACGVIGSIQNCIYEGTNAFVTTIPSSGLTTPNAIELQQILAYFKAQKVTTVAIEVSSHGLAQHRLKQLTFTIAAFTNLTRDHLDYHLTLEAYAFTKQRLFYFPKLQYAILNQDDSYGQKWLDELAIQLPVYSYTLGSKPQFNPIKQCSASQTSITHHGLKAKITTPWGQGDLRNTHLLGQFNLSNLLLVITVLGILKIPLSNSLEYVAQLRPIKGRMEKVVDNIDQAMVVIDYAHTPDALKHALQALRVPQGKLWCVFGCGGNRDTGKRPLMGAIAECYADRLIITQDNPRYEASELIIQDILAGLKSPQNAVVEPDRQEAIRLAIKLAKPQDVILIAGKGHEGYQTIGDTCFPLSDHEIVKQILT